MAFDIVVRSSRAVDEAAIAALYADAFPDEDLWPLVEALLRLGPDALSLIALSEDVLTGHVAFTRCAVRGAKSGDAALLGPLAIAASRRRAGVGGALIREGLERLAGAGVAQVNVLGDPGYYGRFGFVRDNAVAPPYPLPDEWKGAWASVSLDASQAPLVGTLAPPAPWMRPGLWAP